MGWCSGSELGENLWGAIKDFLPEDVAKKVAVEIYTSFSEMDADCWQNGPDSLETFAMMAMGRKFCSECHEWTDENGDCWC